MKSNYSILGFFLIIAFFMYVIHKNLFTFAQISTDGFYYSIDKMYLLFSLFSIIIILVLIKVKERNLDIVGNTFLLLTTLKMIGCYVLVRPILKLSNTTEKWNFFTLFILFLLIETSLTISLLNKDKETNS